MPAVLQKDQAVLFLKKPPLGGEKSSSSRSSPSRCCSSPGAGHVGQAVAWQADLVGFEVVVLDDRPELFSRSVSRRDGVSRGPNGRKHPLFFPCGRHVHRDRHAGARDGCPGPGGLSRSTGRLRGDDWKPAEGGPDARDFIESGRTTAAAFDRVHAPIGLDIGAATVPEIAASIVAQLIAVRRGGRAERQLAE